MSVGHAPTTRVLLLPEHRSVFDAHELGSNSLTVSNEEPDRIELLLQYEGRAQQMGEKVECNLRHEAPRNIVVCREDRNLRIAALVGRQLRRVLPRRLNTQRSSAAVISFKPSSDSAQARYLEAALST